MTSKEIENEKPDIPATAWLGAPNEQAFWLREIALQLAIANERPRAQVQVGDIAVSGATLDDVSRFLRGHKTECAIKEKD